MRENILPLEGVEPSIRGLGKLFERLRLLSKGHPLLKFILHWNC
jgi:hypothetical protein